MEVAIAISFLAVSFSTYKVHVIGLHNIERRIARWLLIDAFSWEAKGKAKLTAQKKMRVA
jgi:hypothetical protein